MKHRTTKLATGEGWVVEEAPLKPGVAYLIMVDVDGEVSILVSDKIKMSITNTFKLAAKMDEIAKGFQSAGLSAQARLDEPTKTETDH